MVAVLLLHYDRTESGLSASSFTVELFNSMNSVSSETAKPIQYPRRTVERAERALRCSPFKLKLFTTMRDQSVKLNAIGTPQGVELGYVDAPLSELSVENYLMWLIQVGLLRREVDGQGITDSFRLTPLGRQRIETWQNTTQTLPTPSRSDRFYNILNRWFRLPV